MDGNYRNISEFVNKTKVGNKTQLSNFTTICKKTFRTETKMLSMSSLNLDLYDENNLQIH